MSERKCRHWLLVVTLVFVAIAPVPSQARAVKPIGEFIGQFSDNKEYYDQNKHLEMTDHSIHFTENERNIYDVTEKFIFHNKSNKDIRALLFLPMASQAYQGGSSPIDIRKMVSDVDTRLDGEIVEAKFQRTQVEYFYYNFYYFEATFAPGAQKVVDHRYRLRPSFVKPDTYFIEFWGSDPHGSSIGHFEAIFEFADRVPRHLDLNPRVPPPMDARHHNLLWERGSFMPTTPASDDAGPGNGNDRHKIKENFECFYTGGPTPTLRLTIKDSQSPLYIGLNYLSGWEVVEDIGPPKIVDHKVPCGRRLQLFLETWAVTDELVACYEPETLVNFVYASRGFDFDDPKLNEKFYGNRLFRKSDTPFSESWFSKEQKAAIDKLKGAAK